MKLVSKLEKVRKITRVLGLNSFIHKIIYNNNSYEEKFDKFFTSKIEKGSLVYDIGANIGHYSLIYSKLVGENGKVVSFEPSIENFLKLESNCLNNKNILNLNLGVGSKSSKFWLSQGKDDIGATSRIIEAESGIGNWIEIEPLDSLVYKYGIPNAIKIDVEGFEMEVLEGGKSVLVDDNLRVIGIEIHTEILNKRGIHNCHNKIEKILLESGFKIQHTDFSHIIGYK
jgi:FkbM family methyltransferase